VEGGEGGGGGGAAVECVPSPPELFQNCVLHRSSSSPTKYITGPR
jgi:hypothetical protein